MNTLHNSKNTNLNQFSKNDVFLLSLISKHEVVTIRQLSVLTLRSCQVIRRRIRFLEDHELIFRKSFGYGNNEGRPEEIILLSQQGCDRLKSEGIIAEKLPLETGNTRRSNSVDHQLLLNWFRIHLHEIDKMIPYISTTFLDLFSQSCPPLFPTDTLSNRNDNFFNNIIPDGIVIMKHTKSGKSLLFFLEVDMNTETLVSKSGNRNDIRHKIQQYQDIFRSGQYKCLEKVADATLNGFRTLFLTNTEARLISLCNLVQETQNAEFIWLTDKSMMFTYGLSANIWVRSGNINNPRESILGSKQVKETPILKSIH